MAKKKVGAAMDTLMMVVVLGAVGVGGYLVWKYVLSPGSNSGAGAGTGGNNQQLSDATKAAAAATLAAQAAAGQTQTLSDVQLEAIASTVRQLGQGDSPDLSQIEQELISVNNLTDLTKVIQYFGVVGVGGGAFCDLMGIDCSTMNLASWVKVLYTNDPYTLSSINSFYTAQGINFQF